MKPIITKINKELALVTLLDSEMPQTHAVEKLTFDDDTDEIIVDNVVRTRLTDQRFTDFVVNNGKDDLTTKNYIQASEKIVKAAKDVLTNHLSALQNSILTQREIDKLIK